MSNPISRLISIVEELILRAVFIGCDEWWRHSSSLLILALVIMLVYVNTWCSYGVVIVSLILLIIHLVARTYKLFLYSFVLALIPTVWYILTSLPFTHSISTSTYIGIRVLVNTLSILTGVFMLNPMEISFILSKLGIKEWSAYPALLWKVIPHTLRDMESALLVNDLKNEKLWKGVAISLLASLEYSKLYEEALYLRLRYFRPKFNYDKRALLMHTLPLISLLIYVVLINYIQV